MKTSGIPKILSNSFKNYAVEASEILSNSFKNKTSALPVILLNSFKKRARRLFQIVEKTQGIPRFFQILSKIKHQESPEILPNPFRNKTPKASAILSDS